MGTIHMREDLVSPAKGRARDAAIKGIPEHECPYPTDSISAKLWFQEYALEMQEDEEAICALIKQRGRLGK